MLKIRLWGKIYYQIGFFSFYLSYLYLHFKGQEINDGRQDLR